jgi:type I restriction-modification system DNA methylase subunit
MSSSGDVSKFDHKFWIDKLSELGYPLKTSELDVTTLKAQKALPSDLEVAKVSRLYFDDYVEAALIEVGSSVKLRRSSCTRTTRAWKENRLIKPLLFFTNGADSFAVVVPGKGIGGEAKVLGLSDRLYRTDLEVLESMRFPGEAEELSRKYDGEFFPYEKVRDEFFEGYRDLYERVEKAVRRDLKAESTSYAQRFLGRLMFLYFLQRKGWLKEDRHFIDTVKDYRDLNRLFYGSLNKEGTPGIPFLNGSLFEREEYMTAQMESRLYPKTDELFRKARRFFNEYNFTVDETSPLEVEVSIDPALIGTVFENMLPEYERGSKGTFYTPRAESSFICRRALSSFLGLEDVISHDGKTFNDGLDKYLEQLERTKSEKGVREFRDKLLSVRVLDPAVGSGGFLLVMMQEIIGLIQSAEAIVGWKTDAELYKKKILPNLYGFDIEPEAIEIARLRLWLSLIIDQKEPEPLPNLDMNIIVINDSLVQPDSQITLDPRIEELRQRFSDVKTRYLNEHKGNEKKKLREQLHGISKTLAAKTGIDPNAIEGYMPQRANIVVMNPPYVRQEALLQQKKEYYVKKYSLDKKSDLFVYFLMRTLSLLSEDGIASVISSDKWLEVDYGVSLQKKLKENLIAIYGQRKRTFGADINTVITVYRSKKTTSPTHFTYLETYAGRQVRNHVAFRKNDLPPGKWFYLKAPKVFLEKILPKLPFKLEEIADIKRGFTTGANEFFYMRDVGKFYETDRLANPRLFDHLRVRAKNQQELGNQGLAYMENEEGERVVIERKSMKPLLRSIRDFASPLVETEPSTYCLALGYAIDRRGTSYTARYITSGERRVVEVTRGAKRKKVVGYHSLSTTKARPIWYVLPSLKPTHIALPELFFTRMLNFYSKTAVLADHLFDMVYPHKSTHSRALWLYLNSTVYFTMLELWSPKMGGGALHPRTTEYKAIPTPDIEALVPYLENLEFGKRETLSYDEEIRQSDKRALDNAVLKGMGFKAEDAEKILPELYESYVEMMRDRLIKAGKMVTEKVEQSAEESAEGEI